MIACTLASIKAVTAGVGSAGQPSARHFGWACALLLVACLGLQGRLQAATLNAPDEPLSATVAPGITVLDKALTGSVSTGNDNLDLLLEMQRNDAADASQPLRPRSAAPTRPGLGNPVGKASPALLPSQAASAVPPSALPRSLALSQSLLLGADAGLGTAARATPAQAKADWTGARTMPMGIDSGADGGRSRYGNDLSDGHRAWAEVDDGSLRFWPRRVRDFLQENLAWVLGGIAGVLLLSAAIKAYARRV